MGDLVRYEVVDAIAVVTLNNPARRNAWSLAMETQYVSALERATADRSVRALVLTGADGNFCPGPDASDLVEIVGANLDQVAEGPLEYALRVPKPMFAAVEGLCAGIGLMLALTCDVRFIAEGARLSTAYARRGLPAEHAMSWLLPRVVGLERALDLLLSARTLAATDAVAIGLGSRLVPHGEALRQASDYATELARRCSPRSLAAIRRQVWGDLNRSFGVALDLAYKVAAEFDQASPDFAEGVRSFLERRPPNFAPLDPDTPLPPIGGPDGA